MRLQSEDQASPPSGRKKKNSWHSKHLSGDNMDNKNNSTEGEKETLLELPGDCLDTIMEETLLENREL